MKINRKVAAFGIVLVLAAIGGTTYFVLNKNEQRPVQDQQNTNNGIEQTPTKHPTQEQPVVEPPEEPALPQPTGYDIDSPSSINVVVNKKRPLPADYVPNDLIVPDVRLRLAASHEQMKFRATASEQLKSMFDAAATDGVTLVFGSGYRSYALQKQFYDSYVARDGQAAADRYSARPGTSEHQTGLSFDATSPSQTCHLEICFEDTEQGQWLAANAHTYGFHLRYREGKESITGYQYEPWHFRYLGTELAATLYQKNLTLEEYFNL